MLNNNKENLNKFDVITDEGIFIGYSIHRKAYRVYNKRTLLVEESVHINFDEYNSISRKVISDDINEVEKNLEKLDIQPSSTDDLQKEDKAQETSLIKQNADESLPRK